MSYMTPYDVYEREVGEYDPDNPPDPYFSVWLMERKREYLAAFPERAQNQIDGHFCAAELTRFFQWISDTRRA